MKRVFFICLVIFLFLGSVASATPKFNHSTGFGILKTEYGNFFILCIPKSGEKPYPIQYVSIYYEKDTDGNLRFWNSEFSVKIKKGETISISDIQDGKLLVCRVKGRPQRHPKGVKIQGEAGEEFILEYVKSSSGYICTYMKYKKNKIWYY